METGLVGACQVRFGAIAYLRPPSPISSFVAVSTVCALSKTHVFASLFVDSTYYVPLECTV